MNALIESLSDFSVCVTTHIYSCSLEKSIALTNKWTRSYLTALHRPHRSRRKSPRHIQNEYFFQQDIVLKSTICFSNNQQQLIPFLQSSKFILSMVNIVV